MDDVIVIYNRVPKTGSTSFVGLAYDLYGANRFHIAHVNVTKNSHILSTVDQVCVCVRELSADCTPFFSSSCSMKFAPKSNNEYLCMADAICQQLDQMERDEALFISRTHGLCRFFQVS